MGREASLCLSTNRHNRRSPCTTTFELSLRHSHNIFQAFKNRYAAIRGSGKVCWVLTYQRLHKSIPAKGIENRENMTGLSATTPSLVIMTLISLWSNVSDEQDFTREVENTSKKKACIIRSSISTTLLPGKILWKVSAPSIESF